MTALPSDGLYGGKTGSPNKYRGIKMHDNFIDEKCPVCEKTFDANSDIVVCPECGAPYHRECFAAVGHCKFEKEHAPDFEWKGEKQALREHLQNMEEARIQSEQSAAETEQSSDEDEDFILNEQIRKSETYEEFQEAVDKRLDKLSGDIPESDGVTGRDMKQFLGKNALYYLPTFVDILKNKKVIKPNYASFFFSPFHCFYRRMNLFGTVITLVIALVYELRLMLSAMVKSSSEISAGQAEMIITAVWIGFCGLLFFLLLFFNYFYLKTVIKKIKHIKSETASPEELTVRLCAEGRPSMFNAVVYPLCIFFLVAILFRMLNFWLGL